MAKKWIEQTSHMQRQMELTEKETIDVITFLKKQDEAKDIKVQELQRGMQEQHNDFKSQRQDIVSTFQSM